MISDLLSFIPNRGRSDRTPSPTAMDSWTRYTNVIYDHLRKDVRVKFRQIIGDISTT